MCKRNTNGLGLTRKQRKILNNNTAMRLASEAAERKGVPKKIIQAGITQFSYSGEYPSWINAA